MSQNFSRVIVWGSTVLLVATPIAALYLLFNLDVFAALARENLKMPIQWSIVTGTQWYGFWFLTACSVIPGWASVYFLRRAFNDFAQGKLFELRTCRDLRVFSILLFAQALVKCAHFALSSLWLSSNHPQGQKILSIAIGSDELMIIALAMILWVVSDLLVTARQIDQENKQFI